MTAPTIVRTDLGWTGRGFLDGRNARVGGVLREALHRGVWSPVLRHYSAPFRVAGAPPDTPAIYVANHASHADTVAVRAAGGRAFRRRLWVAAADDYFFSSPLRATAFTIAVGAFPFPRRGDLGLRRANALLTEGWSVLLYPQGTRAAGSEFRTGALRLASEGWPLVPVGIAGTDALLPKGARWPRRAPTAVVFGTPLTPADLQGDGARTAFVDSICRTADHARRLAAR